MKPFTHAIALPKYRVVYFVKVPTDSSCKRLFCFYGDRQGALADGLHGLNPRITAHCYTPVQKATSVDLATGKTQRTSVVIKALWISEQIRHAHLGLFVYLIHLKAWRGKEEMALSTLGELWSKGIECIKIKHMHC